MSTYFNTLAYIGSSIFIVADHMQGIYELPEDTLGYCSPSQEVYRWIIIIISMVLLRFLFLNLSVCVVYKTVIFLIEIYGFHILQNSSM